MQTAGTLIAIESDIHIEAAIIDEVIAQLKEAQYQVEQLVFPQTNRPSSYFTRQLASGHYGDTNQHNPYTQSLLQLVDIFDATNDVTKGLHQGSVVIAQHGVGAIMAEQGKRFYNNEERRGFYVWLDSMANSILGIPRPAVTLILTADHSTNNTSGINTYVELSQLFPSDFKLLELERSGKLLDTPAVVELLRASIQPVLPAEAPIKFPSNTSIQPVINSIKSTPDTYYLPSGLSEESSEQYISGMQTLLGKHAALVEHLNSVAIKQLHLNEIPELQLAAQAALPVGAMLNAPLTPLPQNSLVSTGFGSQTPSVRLIAATPRNELDLLPRALYQSAHLSFTELTKEINAWSYSKKATAFKNTDNLHSLHYQWDILDSFMVMHALQTSGFCQSLEHQILTPRYGFEVPKIIEDTNATQLFEDCFDTSLKLQSQLVAAGQESAAQYLTLAGHKVRFLIEQNGTQAEQLLQSDTLELKELRNNLGQILISTHPLSFSRIPKTLQS